MSPLFLALHIGLAVGLEDALPDKISPLPLEHAPKCSLSKMEESIARFLLFAVIVNNVKDKMYQLKSEQNAYC